MYKYLFIISLALITVAHANQIKFHGTVVIPTEPITLSTRNDSTNKIYNVSYTRINNSWVITRTYN